MAEQENESGYKITTHGRAIIAACLSLEQPLHLTRVTVGDGDVPADVDPATVHALYREVADGEIGQRHHEDDCLKLTVQYSNTMHPDVPTFYLSEYMIFATDPETGEETDFAYAKMGAYLQPVPAYREGKTDATFQFPMSLVISDEIDVKVSASPGLVTYDELAEAVAEEVERHNADPDAHGGLLGGDRVSILREIAIPAEGWDDHTGNEDAPDDGTWLRRDVAIEEADSAMQPDIALSIRSLAVAKAAGLFPCATAHDGFLRFWARKTPTAEMTGTLSLHSAVNSGGAGYRTIRIPVSAWEETEGSVYAYRADIATRAAKASSFARISLALASMQTARDAALCPTVETFNGYVRFSARRVPTAQITGSISFLFSSGGGYALPAATSTALGAVKVPEDSGIVIDAEGNVRLKPADSETLGGVKVPEDSGIVTDEEGNARIREATAEEIDAALAGEEGA